MNRNNSMYPMCCQCYLNKFQVQTSVGFRKCHFSANNKVIKLIIHEEMCGQERQSFCSHRKDDKCPSQVGLVCWFVQDDPAVI